ncbi:hypothetical protein Fmac_023314 [Flemingia macrophylla]|uniref:protein-serine/threonine phosphatase n=1 Tax=Flemingia macrophylla TaxID=520843 RepID=A0ABD1LL85_9FABA
MLRLCYGPLDCCFRRRADGLLWHTDLRPHASGDFSIAVAQANYSLEDQSQVFTSPSATYVGVYDGHGGPEASRFVNKRLFPYLHSNHSLRFSYVLKMEAHGFAPLSVVWIILVTAPFHPDFPYYSLYPILHKPEFATEQGGLSVDVIKKAFSATEEEFLHLVKRKFPISPQIASVGSCCLFGAISNNVLYVANLGDSRAVLGKRDRERRDSPVVAQRLSTDHNVADEEVRREVEALHPDDSHIVVYTRGVWRIKGIIQDLDALTSCDFLLCLSYVFASLVSRSIGDVYLKKPDFFQQFGNPIPLKRPVMTAEPSIIIRELESEDLFLIFASDGLWEQLSDEAAVQIVFKYPRAGIAKRLVRAALQEAAKKREMRYDDIKKIDKRVRRHFHDDITVIVIYLDHHAGSSKSNGRVKNTTVGYTTAPVDIFSLNEDEAEKSMLGAVA